MSLSYVIAATVPTTICVTRVRCFLGTQATSPAADTFTEIGGVSEIPSFGPTDNPVKTATIPSGIEITDHGTTTLGGGSCKAVYDPTDAGQIALIAAQLVKTGNYNWRMIAPNNVTGSVGGDPSVSHGTIIDIKVKVLGAQIAVGGPGNVLMADFSLGYNSLPTYTSAS